MSDVRAAILEHLLGKAFTTGTLVEVLADLWQHAYDLGYMHGQDACACVWEPAQETQDEWPYAAP
jgi:hypothetical protein